MELKMISSIYINPFYSIRNMRVSCGKDLIEKLRKHLKYGGHRSRQKKIEILLDVFNEHADSLSTPQEKIMVLKFLSDLVFDQKTPLATMRKTYDLVKNTKEWKILVDSKVCYTCSGRAHVRHHIIELGHGGKNYHENIRCLCNNCHSKIHPWLAKYS